MGYLAAYAVAFASLLAGASVVHYIYQPDLVSRALQFLEVHGLLSWAVCLTLGSLQTIPLPDRGKEGTSDSST